MNSFRIELKQSLLSNWRSCLAVFLLLCGLVFEFFAWCLLVYGRCHPEVAVVMVQIVASFLIACFAFAIVFDCLIRVKQRGRWMIRLGYLFLYFIAFLVSYFLLPHDSRVVFVGEGAGGVVSSSVLDSVLLFLIFSIAILLTLSCFESCVRIINMCSVGLFAVVTVLASTMLDKYDLLQVGLHNVSNMHFELLIEEYNLNFSMMLAYMVSYAVFVLQSQNRTVRGESMNAVDNLTMPVRPETDAVVMSASVESSSVQHGSAGRVTMPLRLEGSRSSSRVSVGSSGGPGGALPKQLMGAAVSGLVAGACFSLVNRLFSRR